MGRGEIFETIEFISYLRQNVIGPLILLKKGKQPKGVRKIEIDAPEYLDSLKLTISDYSKKTCYKALKNIVSLYKELREESNYENIKYNSRTEKAAIEYLDYIYKEYV